MQSRGGVERRRTPYGQKTRWLTDAPLPAPAHAGPSDKIRTEAEAPKRSDVAIDPVCKMVVDIPTARYTSQYEGTIYFFCAPGCKAEFDADPAAYLATDR